MRQRPVRGRKKPSARILANSFGMGFWRFFSTATRDEKVRTLSMSGPETRSAASIAMVWSIDFSSVRDRAVTGEEEGSSAYIWWNLLGSRLDGKGVFSSARRVGAPVNAASCFAKPANSRAPSPMVVRIVARWPMEYSPLKYVRENHWPICKGLAIRTAIMPCSRISWNPSISYLSPRPTRRVARSSR